MLATPFTFYRGAAAVMAQDFDETLRGPWEWDVKRLAASLAVAAGSAGMDDGAARSAAETSGCSYRRHVAEYACMRSLEVWYATVDVDMVERLFARQGRRSTVKIARRVARRARLHDSIQALSKLTEIVEGRHVIRHDPPLVCRLDDDPEVLAQVGAVVTRYLETLTEERRFLLHPYTPTDLAMKVVGFGSVGTRCFIGLFHGDGADEGSDPLFLQVKEALPSVLEPYLSPSLYSDGQRVVVGQRMMQAFPDMFLG